MPDTVDSPRRREPSTSAPPSWLVLLLAVACGLTVANLYYAQPLLAALRDTFHLGTDAVGGLVTTTQLGYAVGMLFLVPLGDRVENRRLVTVLLTVTTAALVVAGTAPTFPVLLVAALVSGATSVVAQILIPFAADLAQDATRGRVVGQVVSGLLAGVLLSRTLGGLLANVTSWRVVYLVSAALMVVLLGTLWTALPRRSPSTRLGYGRLLRSTARLVCAHPTLRRRALYQAAMFGAFSAFWTTIAFVLTGPPFHYSQLGVGLFALVGAGGAVVAPLAGRWADRGLTRPMTGVAFAVAALAFTLAGLGRHDVVALAVAAVLVDMAVQAAFVLGQHTIYQLDSTARARLNSVYIATFFLGGAIGSQAGSFAYRLGGWTAVTAFGATLPVLALLALAFEPGRRRAVRRSAGGATV
ncbi:MFS transporter [Solihabitans fulvus]|uniref:MFS transporter n=1 Tax=Solihabitans fulvus TaxID=1892852 RepID=A0A5B2WZ63_9PSEU|nr:MFS transporter [Solihabitans fulvus]